MVTFPIIPADVVSEISALVAGFCPLSQVEIVDNVIPGSEEDQGHRIFKFIGLVGLETLESFIPAMTIQHYRTDAVALYESMDNKTAIFWHDGVVTVLISSTEEQHNGVMRYYADAALLLTQIGNSELTTILFDGIQAARRAALEAEQAEAEPEPAEDETEPESAEEALVTTQVEAENKTEDN